MQSNQVFTPAERDKQDIAKFAISEFFNCKSINDQCKERVLIKLVNHRNDENKELLNKPFNCNNDKKESHQKMKKSVLPYFSKCSIL